MGCELHFPRSFWLFLVFEVFLGTENVLPGPYISALNLYMGHSGAFVGLEAGMRNLVGIRK